MAVPAEITVTQLSRLIGPSDALTIIDVRIPGDFQADPRLVADALRKSFTTVQTSAKCTIQSGSRSAAKRLPHCADVASMPNTWRAATPA